MFRKVRTATGFVDIPDYKALGARGAFVDIDGVVQKQANGTFRTIWERGEGDPTFVAVEDITCDIEAVPANSSTELSGTVFPPDATNQTITWSRSSGPLGSSVQGNRLITGETGGSVKVTATVRGGLLNGRAGFVKNFTIFTSEASTEWTSPSEAAYPFNLHSRKDANHVIYLDFGGHTTIGTEWNLMFTNGVPIVTPPIGDLSDPAIQQRIQHIWQRVADKFASFDINVTTEEPPPDHLRRVGQFDAKWGVRVVIGGNSDWIGSIVGGAAFLHSFNFISDVPCFVFPEQLGNNEKNIADAAAHEAGHTFGLLHSGQNAIEYFMGGHGWAPIMGSSYIMPLAQWDKGGYPNATNVEDQLAIIVGNGFGYRTKTRAGSLAEANSQSPLVFDASGTLPREDGVIIQNTDVDYYRFVLTDTRYVSFAITPGYSLRDSSTNSPHLNVVRDAMLDVKARLWNSSGNEVVASSKDITSPVTPAKQSDSFTNVRLAAGTYYLSVEGTGRTTPVSGIYSDYGSIGCYSITGSATTNIAPAMIQPVSLAVDLDLEPEQQVAIPPPSPVFILPEDYAKLPPEKQAKWNHLVNEREVDIYWQ